MSDLDDRGIRPSTHTYTDDFRSSNRIFEGDQAPVDITASQLASVINTALRVGRGTETLKSLTDLARSLGLRRVK